MTHFEILILSHQQVGGFYSPTLADPRKQRSVFRNEELRDSAVAGPQLQLLRGQRTRRADPQRQQEPVHGGPSGQSFFGERSQYLLQ